MTSKTISINDLTKSDQLFQYVTFASDVDIGPAEFRMVDQIVVDEKLGNGEPFFRQWICATPSTEQAVFRQSLGCLEIKIYND